MKIAVCYKLVPDEQDIVINGDHTISFDKAEWKIGQYDLVAVEAAMRLAEVAGGTVSALSAGGKQLENSKLKKNILSRGPVDAYMIIDETMSDADSYQTAYVLAKAIEKIKDVDLVVCGEGSSDMYAQQVGSQIGELLQWPSVNAIGTITLADGKLIAERMLETEVEVLEIPIPAVISVTSDIFQARIANLKDILEAGKKPVVRWDLDDIGGVPEMSTNVLSVLAPPQADRRRVIIGGDSGDQINEFYEHLRKEL
ncbi:MAG: electron transfer flavoprotein [Syntrophales bacterium]|nr:electron transfer flavoprotein [Syntrophales bacterium]